MTTKTFFVAGAHTDVGKTHVSCALLRAARAAGRTTAAFKPVVSGFDPGAWRDSDPGRLLDALGEAHTVEGLARISPHRFAAPLAPPVAARREGQELVFARLLQDAATWLASAPAELRLVEGAGGLMSPIAEGATCLDLIRALELPVLFVGGAYLGAISHTLTAIEVLRAHGIPVAAIVMSQDGAADAPDFDETVGLLTEHLGELPLVAAVRRGEAWAGPLLRILEL